MLTDHLYSCRPGSHFSLKFYIALVLYHTSRYLMTLNEKALENIVRKGENAGNQHFLLFLQCFVHVQKHVSIFY